MPSRQHRPGGTLPLMRAGPAQWCEIRFSDTGAGMDGQTLERIFDPFFTTKQDGTGLGLPITRKIIEGHGGTIAVESRVGKGTKVIVRLPSVAEGISS